MTIPTRRFMLAPLAALSLLATTSCKKAEPDAASGNQIAFNDYEAVVGWMPTPESITRERAHSGSYCVKVGGPVEFGLGYSLPLEKAIDHKPHKIRIEAWGYMSEVGADARLGFQIFDPVQNKEFFGDGINYLVGVQSPGKWAKISKDITIPPGVTSNMQLRVFLWRASSSGSAYLDDLRISEVD